jgi:predicted Zn-dependent peptidase
LWFLNLEQYYTPNNATLVVVGDVQADAVIALAKKYFLLRRGPANLSLIIHVYNKRFFFLTGCILQK